MACKIPNQQLKELFFKGLNYDFETYKVYRNVINKFLELEDLDNQSKVYSIWFMGLLYNRALEMDSNIITENLPLQISVIVKEKLFDKTADFTELLQQIKDVLSPAVEAELEGAAPVSDKKADIEKRRKEELSKPFGEGTPEDFIRVNKEYGITDQDRKTPETLQKAIIDKINAKYDAELDALEGAPTAPVSDIEAKKAIGQELISIVWSRLAKQGITNADSIVGTRDTIENVDFDKFWSNVTKEDLQNLKKQYETKKKEQLDLYNKFKGEFDPSTGTFTSDDTSFFDNKIKLVDAELAAIGSVAPTPAPKPKTFTAKINDLLSKVSKAKDFATAKDLMGQFIKLVDQNASLNNAAKVGLYKKLSEAVSRMPEVTNKALLSHETQASISNIERVAQPGGFLNIGDVIGIGKDFYIITKTDGTLVEAVFNPADQNYYAYSQEFTGENFESLDPVAIEETDHIQPIYRVLENLSETDVSGDYSRYNLDFLTEGIRTYGVVRNPNQDVRTGLQIISDKTPTGLSIATQIKFTADRRAPRLFANRLRRIRQSYPDFSGEVELRPKQITELRDNPKLPVVAMVRPTSGVELKISDIEGLNYDILETLDNLRFVYADNRIEKIDWTNKNHVDLFKGLVQVKKKSSRGVYEYVQPNDGDLSNLIYAQQRIEQMKEDIQEMMGDEESMEIPLDIMNEYLTISNRLTQWEFVGTGELNPVQSLDEFIPQLQSVDSVIQAKIARVEFGRPGLPKDYTLVGIVKNTESGLVFENVIPANHVLLDQSGNPTSIEEVFVQQGFDRVYAQDIINKNKANSKYKTGVYYLYQNAAGKWIPRMMQKAAPAINNEEVVEFMSALTSVKDFMPEFNEQNIPAMNALLQEFNNRGWGFNEYRGIIAQIEYFGVKGTDEVYGIRFRARTAAEGGTYPYIEEFNNQKIEIQFPFEPYDVRRQLQEIYKAFPDIATGIREATTVQERLGLARELSIKLRQNKEALPPAVRQAIGQIVGVYNKAQGQIFNQGKAIITAHAKDVAKGGKPYLDNINGSGKTTFMQQIFSNPTNGTLFKLRSAFVGENPYSIYKVFDRKAGQPSDKIVRIKLADTPVVSDPKALIVSKPAGVPVSPAPTTSPTGPVLKTARRRIQSLVSALDGIQTLGTKAFADEVADIKRMMGIVAETSVSPLGSIDADGVVLGLIEDRVIRLDSNIRAKGVAYHEAFHAIFRFSLTGQDRQKYYDAVKKITGGIQQDDTGKFILSRGKKVYLDEFRSKRRFYGFPDDAIENLIYEEYMADGFSEYIAEKREPKNALLRLLYNFLEKLIGLFKSAKYKAARDVRRLYEDIDQAKYADVLSADPYQGPVAYQLAYIPRYINQNNEVIEVPMDTLTYDQLKNKVVKALAKRGVTTENFDKQFDAVTESLISYYDIENLIRQNPDQAEAIRSTYGPMFSDYRYLLGYAHRYQGQYILDNRAGEPVAYNDFATSFEAFENFKETVRKDYESITVIESDVNQTDDEQAAEIEGGSVEQDDPEFQQANAEEEVNENYDDGGLITLKPYEGSAEFKRLIRYVEYEFEDKALGVSFTKMVNSKLVVNTIRKVVAGSTITEILPKLRSHIDLLKENIDAFYRLETPEGVSLYEELGNKIPPDMLKLIDEAKTLEAVYTQFTEAAGLDPAGQPTIKEGAPMLAMFHKVFETANIEIVTQIITTKKTEDGKTFSNQISNDKIVQRSAYNNALNAFKGYVSSAYANLSNERVNYIKNILDTQYVAYQTPIDIETFNYTVDSLYRLTSLFQLQIPRNLVEFSVAAHTYRAYRRQNNLEAVEYLSDIVRNDFDLYEQGKYFNPLYFYNAFKGLISAIPTNKKVSINNAMEKLIDEYKPAVLHQLKYDPTATATVVKNNEGKSVTPYIPFTPSIKIVSDVKRLGPEATVAKYHAENADWFRDNPWFGQAMAAGAFDPNDRTPQTRKTNIIQNYLQVMSVTAAGGVGQNYYSRTYRSTFRKLGDKSYALSALGMFLDKDYHVSDYNDVFYTFHRPITQFESTGTQFNVTGLYDNYAASYAPGYDKDVASRKIVSNFLAVIEQEFNRINREYQDRYTFKPRREGYNARTTGDNVVNTVDESLRAYQFNVLKDFFAYSDLTQRIQAMLRDAAKAGTTTFDAVLDSKLEDEDRTLRDIMQDELLDYGSRTYEEFVQYLISIDLVKDSSDPSVAFVNIPNTVKLYKRAKSEPGEVSADYFVPSNIQISDAQKEDLLEDFMYNFWFNSLFVNQLFDGDIAVGVPDLITYFKRQKSGVAAGLNERDYTIPESQDVLNYAVIRSQNNNRQINGYIDPNDPFIAVTTTKPEVEGQATEAVAIVDGQGFTSITQRVQQYVSHGLIDTELKDLMMQMRHRRLTAKEKRKLINGGVILNSQKPVVAAPIDYLKMSGHLLIRSDYSKLKDKNMAYVVEQLYVVIDNIDFTDTTGFPDPVTFYQEVMKRIHSFYEPIKGKELLHHLLNAMEYHRTDMLVDETVPKKGSAAPLVIDIGALEKDVLDTNLKMIINDVEVPVIEDGYINLAYSTRSVSKELVYQQVRTSNIKDITTDSIQKKVLATAGLDPNDPTLAPIKNDLNQIRNLNEEIAKSRVQYLQRLFGADNPSVFITQLIKQGMISQGAASNLQKYFEIIEVDGKKKPRFNLNLPSLGKTPLYYFFSLFNKNVFGPKVPGKKFYHISTLGYKIKDETTGEYRYPTIRKQTVTVNGEQVEQVVAEVLIPRELANNEQEVKFFEDLYSQFLGTRIPTASHRSMIVAKVVGYLDSSYGNSIAVPPQVHKWAGSDLDIDTLFTEMPGYYRAISGKLMKYGDYSGYPNTLTDEEKKFLEYLQFVAQDPAFEEMLDQEKTRLQLDPDYKKVSLINGAGKFSENIQRYFIGAESEAGAKKRKEVGKDLSALSELISGVKTDISPQQKTTAKLIERIISVINVLDINNQQAKEFHLPNDPKSLAQFTKEYGNPVTPVLHNKLIVHNMNVLANEKIFDTYVKNSSADKQLSEYIKDAQLLEGVKGVSTLKTSNPFTFHSVAKTRSLNQYAKNMVGGNANINKAVAIMMTAAIDLTDSYTFKVKYNGKNRKTNKLSKDAGVLVGGSIDMAADDGKYQTAGVLNLDINTASVMNAMYAYNYPPQFARLIHSVGIIGSMIKSYSLNNDKSFGEPGQRQYGFTTHLNNQVAQSFNLYKDELLSKNLITPGEVVGTYEINEAAFSIEFGDVTSNIENTTPSDFNITVRDSSGKPLSDELASVVLLGFYQKMNTVANRMSFRIATITNVLKSIPPSFDALSKIKIAADFVKDPNNPIFKDSKKLFKVYPAINTLVNDVVPMMIDTSKDVLLDKTNLFDAVVEMFKSVQNISQDTVVTELKSVLGMSALGAIVKEEMVGVQKKIDANEVLTNEEYLTYAFSRALTSEYWLTNEIENDLQYLKEKFPDNLFLQTLELKEAVYQKETKVIESVGVNRLSLENQEQITDEFLQLVNNEDTTVADMAINIAIHGIVKDGAVSRKGSFLKVIAPQLFEKISDQLDIIQEGFKEADKVGKRSEKTYLQRIDKVFKKIYRTEAATGTKAMISVLHKMVAIATINAEPNYRLRMSFFTPPKTGDAAGFTPGKFAYMGLDKLKQVIDSVVPKNKELIYTQSPKTGAIAARHTQTSVAGIKSAKHNYEFWRADDNGELFWDMRGIPADITTEARELLKNQGIYYTKSGEYGFPLYQVNNYEDGQLFVLTEIDGQPFTSNLFKNLYNAYQEDGDFQFVLRGMTATYKTIPRQGVEKILPNSFTNAVATNIRAGILGEASLTSRRVKKLPTLPDWARVMNESKTIVVSSKERANELASKSFERDGVKFNITSNIVVYSTTPSRKGVLYLNNSPIKDAKGLLDFANLMGYANWDSISTSAQYQNFLNPTKRTDIYLLQATTERISRIEEGEMFGVEAPVTPVTPAAPVTPVSATPEFDKLPAKSATPTMTYAGIGSRRTPEGVLKTMTKIAKRLENLGYTLRSGGAVGADTAFEKGATKKEIFYSKGSTERTRTIAKEIHPAPTKISGVALDLMARNTNQIFGENLDTPVDFVIAWTPDGAETSQDRTIQTGGTGQAIDMASRKGIPVINLANPGWENRIKELITPTTTPTPTTPTTAVKPGVLELFESNPELASIGTPEQYSAYLDTIFPDSKVKDIVYRGGEKEDTRLFQYWTNNRTEAYMYAKANITKGGKITERNPTLVITSNLKKYINDKYGEKAFESYLLDKQDYYNQISETEYELQLPTWYREDIKLDKQDQNDILALQTLQATYDIVKIEDEDDLDKPYTVNDYDVFKRDYDKARNQLDKYFNIEELGQIQIAVLNIKNPYTEEIVQEDLQNDRDAYKNGHDGAFLMDGDHFLVKSNTEQIHPLGTKQDIEDFKKFVATPTAPTQTTVQEKTITYTPVGKERQTYTIRGNKIFNKAGKEVFKEDSVDRNKIFANLAVQEGRAVIVEHKDAKYIVNNRQQIISGTTGKIMQWGEENGDRRAILAKARMSPEEPIDPTQDDNPFCQQ